MPLLASTLGLTVPEYGYVLAVGIASTLVNIWHGSLVVKARKEANVALPSAYASAEEAEKNPLAKKFNCAQRAHGNFLEQYPNALVLLGIAGLRYPVYAAACGTIWLVGRVLYTLGYATGVPEKRYQGSVSYLGLIGLLVMSCMTSYKMVTGGF